MTDTAEVMDAVRQGRAKVDRKTRAIALILHGGRATESQPNRFKDISYLRMLPFAPAIKRASHGHIAPVLVHNTDGGWVADSGSGVVQARELVRLLHDDHGLPIVLLGHSSGGWAALRAGGSDPVAGSVALAPWVADDERVDRLLEKKIRVIHGDRDTVCSPVKAQHFVERLQAAGGNAQFTSVAGGNHALIDKPWRWHALAAQAVVDIARP
ncbi:alpha/beta hydrolase [Yimella sp. cx-51]|uniref:alpha/beta hydrolase n=1 Tax=Yimella sp. cx-51 TaxID=2770551 RepID=UPI00165E97CA|nr:alpha/beta hydrolase [Yimella sp. cx-51]MBC9958391.1 alpha/beta hydrolase [Yimella sp. cx-51]QTH38204.1 hypothetical protein J5M86_00450 [Yimella sp. cx-51]